MPRTKFFTRDFVSLCFGIFLITTAFYILMTTMSLYLNDSLHVGKEYLGIYLSVFVISSLIARPFVGFILDKYGKKVLFLPSIILFIIPLIGHAYTTSLFLYVLFRLIHGFSWAVLTSAGATIAAEISPPNRRGEGIGYFGFAFSVAFAVGPIIGFYLVEHTSFKALFLFSAALTIIAFLVVYKINYPEHIPNFKVFSFKKLFIPQITPIAISNLIAMIPYGCILAFLLLFAREINIVQQAGTFFTVMAIGVAINRVMTGKIFDRRGPSSLACISLFILAVAFFMLSITHTSVIFLVSGFLCGFGIGGVSQVFQAMMNAIVLAEERGGANSTYYMTVDAGVCLGFLIGGQLSTFMTFGQIYFYCAILCGLDLILFIFLVSKSYHKCFIKLHGAS